VQELSPRVLDLDCDAELGRIGEFLRRKTLMFNGYANEVAGLYKGMDLRKFY